MTARKKIKTALKRDIPVMPGKQWGRTERRNEFASLFYEKRGYVPGKDLQVWFEADIKIKGIK